MSIKETIQNQIDKNPIVLYMKGTPDFPMCGFSGKAVHILRECDANFVSFNILEDDELRQGIKDFSQWPTIPQLYIKGEFIGGSDIMTELFESGELQALLTK
ncbi:MAG: monothiol glutaredoxin, Grx4 family [Gammaproteobacteria bacterium RIFCSPHIGHO2_12_FULL_41_15]|nr:MAG: monothiol glutaredoxin, Grx4 family [Gammaproteobacteria bacterium RIFCSPHIGHO2_12_FULL_41_15]